MAARFAAAAVERAGPLGAGSAAAAGGHAAVLRRTEDVPDQDLADWIAEHRPDVVLCGHIHQAPWAEGGSWHARLGGGAGLQCRQADRQGAARHITLDTTAGTAHWFGVFESETVSLGLRQPVTSYTF